MSHNIQIQELHDSKSTESTDRAHEQETISLLKKTSTAQKSWECRFWGKGRRRAKVDEARREGYPVCKCTDTGEIMEPESRIGPIDLNQYFFRCPECRSRILAITPSASAQ